MVLMNRIPEGRSIYSQLSYEKEGLLRAAFKDRLHECGWRFWHGEVPSWGMDLDLALISDLHKRCLCLELKSFIAPAEPRELVERSLEIERGIEQVRTRITMYERKPESLQEALGIDPDYLLSWAVASENSIGGAWVQANDVPVVNAGHLIRRLRSTRSIEEVADWLRSREYLPIEGSHYVEHEELVSLAGWSLEWFGIEPLVCELP